MRIIKLALLAVVLLVLVSVVQFGLRGTPSPAPPRTVEQKALDDHVYNAAAAAARLRAAMRNPKSFELSDVSVSKTGAACYEYRSQNGFGGLNLEHAVLTSRALKVQGDPDFAAAWNRTCTKSDRVDVTSQVLQLLEASDSKQ